MNTQEALNRWTDEGMVTRENIEDIVMQTGLSYGDVEMVMAWAAPYVAYNVLSQIEGQYSRAAAATQGATRRANEVCAEQMYRTKVSIVNDLGDM